MVRKISSFFSLVLISLLIFSLPVLASSSFKETPLGDDSALRAYDIEGQFFDLSNVGKCGAAFYVSREYPAVSWGLGGNNGSSTSVSSSTSWDGNFYGRYSVALAVPCEVGDVIRVEGSARIDTTGSADLTAELLNWSLENKPPLETILNVEDGTNFDFVYGELTTVWDDTTAHVWVQYDFVLYLKCTGIEPFYNSPALALCFDQECVKGGTGQFRCKLNSLKAYSLVKHSWTLSEFVENIYNTITGKDQYGNDLGYKDPVVEGQVQQGNAAHDKIDAFETDIIGQFESGFTDLGLDGFSITGGTLVALGFLSTWVMQFFNAAGDLTLVILLPLFIGVALLLIGRGAMAMVRVRSRSARNKNKGGDG